MNLSQTQHRALGTLASHPPIGSLPRGTIRPDKWGLDDINITRRTYEALLRLELVEVYEDERTAMKLARLTDKGHQALHQADERLRRKISEEKRKGLDSITNEEYAMLYRMALPGPGTTTARGLNPMEWEHQDYLVRTALIAKGCVRPHHHAEETHWHLTEEGARVYMEHRRDTDLVVQLAPLSLELTAAQVEAWRDENGLGPDDDVAQDIVTFLQNDTLNVPEKWKVFLQR